MTSTEAPTSHRRARPGGRSAEVLAAVQSAAQAELAEKGYAGLSHRLIAARAGVDATTVYRRWPTRARLLVDLLLDKAAEIVRVPDTGSLVGDLTAFLTQVVGALGRQDVRRLHQALVAAASEGDEDVTAALREFWDRRFRDAFAMLDRAVARGELPVGQDHGLMIEALVAPAWFRALLSQAPIEPDFVSRCVTRALADPSVGRQKP